MPRRVLDRSFCHRRHLCESLERRLLLSTIHWANKGAPGFDNDAFEANFGSSAEAARTIVQRAIDDWEAVITDFNYSDGSNTYNLFVSAADILKAGVIASGGILGVDPDGVPSEGNITLDVTADGAGWYFDSVHPTDDAEFTNLVAPFAADVPGVTVNDMYTTVSHEIAHVVGFTNNPTARITQFITNTGIDDPNTATPGTLATLNVDGGFIDATFTLADPGHLYEGPAIPSRPDIPIHPLELVNPGRNLPANRRVLISDEMARILQKVYDYEVVMPSTIANMMVQSNHFADALTVSAVPGNVGDVMLFQQEFLGGVAPGIRVTIGTYTEFVFLSETSSITVNTGGGDDLIFLNSNFATPTAINAGTGTGDALFLLPQSPTTITATDISTNNLGTVTYTTALEQINLTGTAGGDDFYVYSTNPATAININAFGGNDFLIVVTDQVNLLDHGVTWNGGAGADVLQFALQNTTAIVEYRVELNSDVRVLDLFNGGDFLVTQTGFDTILDRVNVDAGTGDDQFTLRNIAVRGTFNGNAGEDFFQVGNGDLGFSNAQATLVGGPDDDTLALNDSAHAGATDWALDGDGVQRNSSFGAQVFPYTGFEGINIRTSAGGAGGNDISLFGSIPVNVRITGGAGADRFFLAAFANAAGIAQLDALFDGGGGFNTMIVDDSGRGFLTYDMYPARLDIQEALADDGDFDFANIGSMTVTASGSTTTLNVFGTPASIAPGNQTTVFLGGGNDIVNLYPHDAEGNLTVTDNLGIAGESGADTFTVQDGRSLLPINYAFSNPFGAGTQNVFGMGTAGVGTAGIETLTVNAGDANDTFALNQYASGTSLNINAGGGDDVIEFGNGNLPANISNISQFIYDGQAGFDTFNVNNAAAPGTWQYQHNSNVTSATRTAGGPLYGVTPFPASVESVTLNAGAGADTLLAEGVVSGQALTFNANDGDDAVNIASNAAAVRGPIIYNAGAGTNRLNQFNNTRPTPITAHLTTTTLGAHPDDTLFTPGGYIQWDALQVIDLTIGGNAEDAVFASPNETATITLRGGSPAVAPGDSLTLDFSTATNPVLTPSGSNGGTYTFDDRAALTYVSFETTGTVALPGWLDPFSEATWDAGTSTLLVTGSAAITADPSLDAPAVVASGSAAVLTIAPPAGAAINLGGLTLTAGAAATVSADGETRALFVDGANFSIDAESKIDLNDNAMVLRNGGSGSAGQSAARLTAGYLKSGLENNGVFDWQGAGVSSSEAAAQNGAAGAVLYGIGVFQNNLAAAGTPDGTTTDEAAGNEIYTSFAGHAVSLNDVLVRYTYMGDADLDGAITGTDYSLTDAGFAGTLGGWLNGDFDHNGAIDGTDYALIDNAFASQSGPPSAFAAALAQGERRDRELTAAGVVG